jgi:phenylalanine-4-hydroxylase
LADTRERVPPHLRRFVVEQDYAAYTAVDHAVWRFVLLQMYDRLRYTAHPAYARGLAQAGMSVERIPLIDEMDRCLSEFGWGAVCVDGFIPPRAFVEFQALGILPVAAEIRRVEHLPYTPAPDIIHEAGGHAPILPDPEYAAFLRRIGECGERAFASARDAQLYDAIFRLSVVKEQRDATPAEISDAERALAELLARPEPPSEAAQLARLYWWTAEYGLVGTPSDYKLYGAGLLSSLAESHFCHDPEVRKIALGRDCVEVDYDITRPQPQLFVVPEFAALHEVLDAVCARFAFRSTGAAGLHVAREAREVATVTLDSGLSLTGEVDEVLEHGGRVGAFTLRGPCALLLHGRLLEGHGREAHPSGLSLALARVVDGRDVAGMTAEQLQRSAGWGMAGRVRVDCEGGLRVEGRIERAIGLGSGHAFVLAEAHILRGPEPAWSGGAGATLILTGGSVASVRAGASDARYHPEADYPAVRAPARAPEAEAQRALRGLYERAARRVPSEQCAVHDCLRRDHPDEWLLRWNLLEALHELGVEPERRTVLARELRRLEERYAGRNPIAMGLRYLGYPVVPSAPPDESRTA